MPFFRSLSGVFASAFANYSEAYDEWRYAGVHYLSRQGLPLSQNTMGGVERELGVFCREYINALNAHPLSPVRLETPMLFIEREIPSRWFVEGGSCSPIDLNKENDFIVPAITVRAVTSNHGLLLGLAMHELDHAICLQLAQRFKGGHIDLQHPLYNDSRKIFQAYTHQDQASEYRLTALMNYNVGIVERYAQTFGRTSSHLVMG
jgi:hypothetical protein